MARTNDGQILIWRNNTVNSTIMIAASLSNPWSLFVTSDETIFADNGSPNRRVDRWTSNGTRLKSPMSVCSTQCSGLFVDHIDNLYCSQYDKHQVVRRSLLLEPSEMTIVAGTGCQGSTADMLNYPRGIFVTINLDLYVADYYNDRVQLFRSGEMTGTTVAGNGSSGIITLNHPIGVLLDADGYLFIVDSDNHRIVGSGPGGFRCLVGCSSSAGSASYELNTPRMMSFDRDGNIFVMDRDNNRVQKFLLSNNSCGKSSPVDAKDLHFSRLSLLDSSTVSSIISSPSQTGQSKRLIREKKLQTKTICLDHPTSSASTSVLTSSLTSTSVSKLTTVLTSISVTPSASILTSTVTSASGSTSISTLTSVSTWTSRLMLITTEISMLNRCEHH